MVPFGFFVFPPCVFASRADLFWKEYEEKKEYSLKSGKTIPQTVPKWFPNSHSTI